MRKMGDNLKSRIEDTVKALLHESRDCLRNGGVDTTKISFHANDSYYAEAFGVMRGLTLCNYGYFGPDICGSPQDDIKNVKWWFNQLCNEVLKEENFKGSNECDYCFKKHGKDAVRKWKK